MGENLKLDEMQAARLRSSLKNAAYVLLAGLGYYLFVRWTGWRIPCLFYMLTEKLCPGCGVTRMCMALAELDFARAVSCNLLVMVLLPFAAFFGIRNGISYIRQGRAEMSKPEYIFIILSAVAAVAFWAVRNIPGFEWLTP